MRCGRGQESGEWPCCLVPPPKIRRSRKERAEPAKDRNCLSVCWFVKPVGEPYALNVHVRFDERGVETGHGEDRRAPADERAGNGYASPKLPRHSSTLLRAPG